MPLYADTVLHLIAALRGRSRKVLVLDLDNTIWGGVIGDDGKDGIRLGQGDPRGEAFLQLQRAALALKWRGILLALCSKNDETIALEAICEHPDMVLREEDFSAFQINWADKATNRKSWPNDCRSGSMPSSFWTIIRSNAARSVKRYLRSPCRICQQIRLLMPVS